MVRGTSSLEIMAAVLVCLEKNNAILGNHVGTNSLGGAGLGNIGAGVNILGGEGNTIGGNVISGNQRTGIRISKSDNNNVVGNLIGIVDTNGQPTKLGNGSFGLELDEATKNNIGGFSQGNMNVISANGNFGIQVVNNSSQNSIIGDNIGIGPDRSRSDFLPNLGVIVNGIGISFDKTSTNNRVKNTVIENQGIAVNDLALSNNRIWDPDSIFNNGYGIANGTMFGTPILLSAVVSSTTITITGTLNSAPSSQYTLEFFGNMVTQRQGQQYLGNLTLTTDSYGYASFTTTLNTVFGLYATATSTGLFDRGYTSEFSEDIAITNPTNPAPIEGQSFNFNNTWNFADPTSSGPYTASINWGDGTTSAGTVGSLSGGVYPVSASHTYAEEGNYTAIATITPTGGSPLVLTQAVDVYDAPLTPTVASISATVNTLLTNTTVATFSDADTSSPASDFTATITWDDGTTTPGTITGSGGSFTVKGNHLFTNAGPFPVWVKISDNGGSATQITSTATVSGAIAIQAVPFSATAATSTGSTLVATFTDSSSTGAGFAKRA